MANGIFNISKGRGVAFYDNVESNSPANSAFVAVLLVAAEADDTLNNYETLADILAQAGNTEASFTNYARKVVTDAELAPLPAPDNANNRRDLPFPSQTFASAGGASNQTMAKVLICYDPDTTAGDDGDIIPVGYYDYLGTTDGSDITIEAPSGFLRAS